METKNALDELQRLGVEIDPSDKRSPEQILDFIQELATISSGVGITPVPEPA